MDVIDYKMLENNVDTTVLKNTKKVHVLYIKKLCGMAQILLQTMIFN